MAVVHPAVPDSVRAAEGVMLQSQAAQSGKPANVLEKMVVGRLNKCAAGSACLRGCTMLLLTVRLLDSALDDQWRLSPLSSSWSQWSTIWCRYYQDVCLLEQPYVMDDSQRVQDVIKVGSVQVV